MLGLDLFKALRLRIENNTVLSHAAASPAVTSLAAPVVEVTEIRANDTETKAGTASGEKLGLAKGFIHQVKVREGVQPVQQKLQRLLLSVRQAVSAELERLLDMDVIERIDASEWISSIMLVLYM